MKKILLAFAAMTICFISCQKDSAGLKAKTKQDNTAEGNVLVRIKNSTAKNFTFFYSLGEEYGNINTGDITGYKSFPEVTVYPYAVFCPGKDTLFAGALICGTPPIPMLENGRYTLEIKEDATWWNGYSAMYIKD
ncbi:MAG: hypothetical protein QM791_22720 [Ferruginibacter sp.]